MNLSNNWRKNVGLAPFTTLGIGGPARFFIKAKSATELKNAIIFARKNKIPFLVIGSGSNLLVNDKGFDGLVIKNNISGIEINGESAKVQSGTLLQELVDAANRNGLGGLEKLTGIPGTVAGAIYGNAGAYGQTISDRLTRVRILDNRRERWLSKNRCCFEYRESVFKKNKHWIILEAELQLIKAAPGQLQKTSKEIFDMRCEKYKPNIKCPGSFFKNVIANSLPKGILRKIPPEKIVYGKVPAGYLLEAVGATGKIKDGVQIASYHGNLFINNGGGTAKAFYELAKGYQKKVKEKFGIMLEPEVQLVGFREKF